MTTRIDDFAVDDADVATPGQLQQAAIVRERLVLAVEGKARKGHVIRATREDEPRTAFENDPRRAAHADDLRASRQFELAGAIFTRSEHQRHARAGGLINRALQRCGLFLPAR